jgi:hypothetical protein
MDKLNVAMGKVFESAMAKMEADSWKEKTTVAFQIFKTVRAKSGREYTLKLESVEQSDRYPSGISRENALSIGTVVREVTTINRRIK